MSEDSLTLSPEERELLAEELGRLPGLDGASEGIESAGPSVEPWLTLHRALEEGSISAELEAPLTDLLELLLEGGGARLRHGPAGERALRDLYFRTRRGRQLCDSARAAGQALEALRGQCLEAVDLRPLLPGSFRLSVRTDRCEVSFDLERRGVAPRAIALGL